MNKILICPDCGFGIDGGDNAIMNELKILRDHLIVAKLFCCKVCVKYITKRIKELKNEYS